MARPTAAASDRPAFSESESTTNKHVLSPEAEEVLSVLCNGEVFETRLRETGSKDIHDLPSFAPSLRKVSLAANELVVVLEQLESRDAVDRREQVSENDTSEYLVTWHARTKKL
jgi:hypothetical protein